MKRRVAAALTWGGSTVLALGALYALLLGASSRSLRRAYAALESDGRPMRAEQVIPAEIPSADNAALVYQTVVLQLKAAQAGERDLWSALNGFARGTLANPPAELENEQFAQLCRTQVASEALAALEKASAKAGCRYNVDYTRGGALLLPHLSDLLTLTRILSATAHVQAANGDAATAWGTILTSLRVADALKHEPILISQLVRMAQFRTAVGSLCDLKALSDPPDEQYEELKVLLKGFEDVAPLALAMDGERLLFGEWAFNLSRAEVRKSVALADENAELTLGLGTHFRPLLQRDHAAYLGVMRAYARYATEPYSSGDARLGAALLGDVPRYCVLTRALVPALSPIKGRFMSMVAQARVARAGLAVQRHQRRTGDYPADLEALNMGVLLDPFTGEALTYQRTATGFAIYSFGENLVDDQGTTSKNRRAGDIVWRYPVEAAAEMR